jgi:iodotyrosine deiodinase
MAFLSRILQRPENERPFVLIPVGYPTEGAEIPTLDKKPLSEITERR